MRFHGACRLLIASILWFPSSIAAADYQSGYAALAAGDFTEAARLLEIESNDGDAFASLALGHLYLTNRGVRDFDLEKSVNLTLQAAEAGNCEAQYLVGTFYFRGYGLEQKEEVALDWFKKSAFCGHSGAQLAVAQSYFHQPNSQDQAVTWLKASAHQGHVHALVLLADLYAEGRDIEVSDEIAMHLYLRAAKNGYSLAALRIADALAQGMAAPPNHRQTANRWRELAAQLAQTRQDSFVTLRKTSALDSKKGIGAGGPTEIGPRSRVSGMANALLESFPMPANLFSDLPEGLPVRSDDDTRRLLPDDQYGIPRRKFVVSEDFQ
jgi:TPR repeat protein